MSPRQPHPGARHHRYRCFLPDLTGFTTSRREGTSADSGTGYAVHSFSASRSLYTGDMTNEKLQELLKELHRELSATTALDPQSRTLVEQVLQDVDRIEDLQEPSASVEGRLREVVLRFESEHPRLATTVGQVADALGKLGI